DDGSPVAVDAVVFRAGVGGWRTLESDCRAGGQSRGGAADVAGYVRVAVLDGRGGPVVAHGGVGHASSVGAARTPGAMAGCTLVSAVGRPVGDSIGDIGGVVVVSAARHAVALVGRDAFSAIVVA